MATLVLVCLKFFENMNKIKLSLYGKDLLFIMRIKIY